MLHVLQGLSGRSFAAGTAFFGAGGERAAGRDWVRLRDRWEYSHGARAAFAMLSLIALVVSLASA
jgi:hypothetical protein